MGNARSRHEQLKAQLVLHRSSLTKFAASLESTPRMVRWAMDYGMDHEPRPGSVTAKILAAVSRLIDQNGNSHAVTIREHDCLTDISHAHEHDLC